MRQRKRRGSSRRAVSTTRSPVSKARYAAGSSDRQQRPRADFAGVLVEEGPEVRRKEEARRGGPERSARTRTVRPTAREPRRARRAGSFLCPRRGSSPREGTSPDRRARSAASGCWERVRPRAGPSARSGLPAPSPTPGRRRVPRRGPFSAARSRASSPSVIPCRTAIGWRPTNDRNVRILQARPPRFLRSDWAGHRRPASSRRGRRPPSRAGASRRRCSTASRRRPRRTRERPHARVLGARREALQGVEP